MWLFLTFDERIHCDARAHVCVCVCGPCTRYRPQLTPLSKTTCSTSGRAGIKSTPLWHTRHGKTARSELMTHYSRVYFHSSYFHQAAVGVQHHAMPSWEKRRWTAQPVPQSTASNALARPISFQTAPHTHTHTHTHTQSIRILSCSKTPLSLNEP